MWYRSCLQAGLIWLKLVGLVQSSAVGRYLALCCIYCVSWVNSQWLCYDDSTIKLSWLLPRDATQSAVLLS